MKENILLSENKKEQVFLDITRDLERIIDEDDSSIIWWRKNNKYYFQQDEDDKILWCDFDLVWSVFEKEFGMKYIEIQAFIRDMMEKHFKLGCLTSIAIKYYVKFVIKKESTRLILENMLPYFEIR
jgi:hypothetical protein